MLCTIVYGLAAGPGGVGNVFATNDSVTCVPDSSMTALTLKAGPGTPAATPTAVPVVFETVHSVVVCPPSWHGMFDQSAGSRSTLLFAQPAGVYFSADRASERYAYVDAL